MTREEALRIFRKEIECLSHTKCEDCILKKACDPMITTPSDSEYIEAYSMAIKALEQEPNWIKCSDHLPDFDVDVLATTKEYGDVVKITRWRTNLKDCGWEWVLVDHIEGYAYNPDEIIAWMPLPKAYKEVEE